MKLITLGPPGAGKGTQAERICKEYNLVQISSGEILREKRNSNTQLGNLIKSYINAGNFVPDDLIINIISNEIRQSSSKNGYILDGFPRNVYQAQVLDDILEKDNEKIKSVLCFRVPDEILVARLSARRTCTVCSSTYHLIYNPPKVPNKCDNDGADLYQRDDDKEATILERINIYHKETMPLIEYYQKKNLIFCVDGSGTIDEIYNIIKKHLDNLIVNC